MACTGRNLEITPDDGEALHERVAPTDKLLLMGWFMVDVFTPREGPDVIGKEMAGTGRFRETVCFVL